MLRVMNFAMHEVVCGGSAVCMQKWVALKISYRSNVNCWRVRWEAWQPVCKERTSRHVELVFSGCHKTL